LSQQATLTQPLTFLQHINTSGLHDIVSPAYVFL